MNKPTDEETMENIDEKFDECFRVSEFTRENVKYFIANEVKALLSKTISEKKELEQELLDTIKQRDSFIRWYEKEKAKNKNTPMGVTEWKTHGKKYGYYKYFEKDVISETEEQMKIKFHHAVKSKNLDELNKLLPKGKERYIK